MDAKTYTASAFTVYISYLKKSLYFYKVVAKLPGESDRVELDKCFIGLDFVFLEV